MNKYSAILLDITNYCNIRCRFCINDWTKGEPKVDMTSETFDKALSLLPLMKRGFMSCAFEPTIHPNFIEYFSRIPKNTGVFTFITTNLSRHLTDNEIEELSNNNLDAISISIGSLVPELYEYFHKGSKFSIFIDNVDRLASACNPKPNAPKLRFITLVFKQNIDEVEKMAEILYERYSPIMHQFRTPFQYFAIPGKEDWLHKSAISREESEIIFDKIEKLPYKHIKVFNPLYPTKPSRPADSSFTDPNGEVNTYFSFRSNGDIVMHEKNKDRLPEGFKKDFNINDIEDPYEFFKKGIEEMK